MFFVIISISKVQTMMMCVVSLQPQQTLGANHFMVPQALDFVQLCDTKQAQDHSDIRAEFGQFRGKTVSDKHTL